MYRKGQERNHYHIPNFSLFSLFDDLKFLWESFDAILRFRDRRKEDFVHLFAIRRGGNMDHDETGCQAAPEGPILCISNCGFFGSPTTMNMCSKCHKDYMLKQDQAKLAASSIGSIVNGTQSNNNNNKGKELVITTEPLEIPVEYVKPKVVSTDVPVATITEDPKVKEGPKRCSTCNKRVGLTGFKCRCGSLYCGVHRYSDKHECPFDYRTAGQDAIAKANPVVKAEKLDKI